LTLWTLYNTNWDIVLPLFELETLVAEPDEATPALEFDNNEEDLHCLEEVADDAALLDTCSVPNVASPPPEFDNIEGAMCRPMLFFSRLRLGPSSTLISLSLPLSTPVRSTSSDMLECMGMKNASMENVRRWGDHHGLKDERDRDEQGRVRTKAL
jgi:hypothetical protein